MQRIVLTFFFALQWSGITVQAQTIRYVSPDGTGNGSSWAQASSMADAVNNAADGDEIWLMQGLYDITTTLELDVFPSSLGISMYGGFNGTETAQNQRNYENNETILDGLGERRILYANSDITIDGIIFQRGFIDGSTGGGAIYGRYGTVLRNCVFRDNISEGSRGAGAVFCWASFSELVIDNCLFENNRTQNYVGSANGGGAIHIWMNDAIIRNSTFRNNSSHNTGGAVYTWSGNNVLIEDCLFENNESDDVGGAIHTRSVLNLSNISFTGNSAETGGAIHNGEALTLNHVVFADNIATDNGGAIHNGISSTVTVANAVFSNNQAMNQGGAIYNSSGLQVTNATFVNNQNHAIVFRSFMGASYFSYIYNSIFYDNSSPESTSPDIAPMGSWNSSFDLDIRSNILQVDIDPMYGSNNQVGVNPQFVNATGGDYRLQPASPAIDAGDDTLFDHVSDVSAGLSTDLDGNPRVQGVALDMGAYEIDPASVIIPECAAIISPLDEAIAVVLDAEIAWTAVDGATAYRISIGTTSGETDVLDRAEVTDTAFDFADGWEENTTYYITVVPFNSAGEATGCAEISFTTETILEIPECTIITAPADGATDVALDVGITWSAVAGADGYHVSIGTTSGGTDVLDSEEVTDTSFSLADGWEENTTYYITVIPFNSAGEPTDCAEISFTTETILETPECTIITAPADDATNVDLDAGIVWATVAGADGYRISLGTTSGGTEVLDSEEVTDTVFSLAAGWEENTTYYVTVIPFNTAGEATGCPEITFATETLPTAPDCVTSITPADNATGVPVDANISWGAVDDADGYYVTIGTTSGGTDIADHVDVVGTSYNPSTDFEENTTYYVTVVPYNDIGEAMGCPPTQFTTVARPEPPQADDQQFCPPATVADLDAIGTDIRWYDQATGGTVLSTTTVLSTGTYYATQVVGGMESDRLAVAVTVQLPAAPQFVGDVTGCGNLTVADLENVETGLRWYDQVTGGTALSPTTALSTGAYYASRVSGDCESDRTAVQIVISVTPIPDVPNQGFVVGSTFADLNVIGQNLRWYTEPTGSTPFDPQTTISNGTYYVSQTIDGCESDRVIVQINITSFPDCVTNITPANNATDIAVNANITWDAVSGATGYRISIGTTSGGTDVVDGEEVTDTSFSLADGWEENTTYYVTVIPFNAAGDATGCTEISFTTEEEELPIPEVPDCTTIIRPQDGERSGTLDDGIAWTAVDGADGYRVSIGTTLGGTDVVDNVVVTGTTFYPTVDFAENTPYFLSVIPFNAAGEATGCAVLRFLIIPDTPPEPEHHIGRTKYGISPNGDGINDFWEIDGIEHYPDNTVSIYNRWGDMVFQLKNYDNQSRVFDGNANKLTRLGGGMLPSGTYFFAIQYKDGQETKKVEGMLVIKR